MSTEDRGPRRLTKAEIVEDLDRIDGLRFKSKCLIFFVTASVIMNLVFIFMTFEHLRSVRFGGTKAKKISASHYTLKDPQGHVRSELAMGPGNQPYLILNGNESGSVRLGFGDNQEDHPVVEFTDSKGVKRIQLASSPFGASVTIADSKGYPSVQLQHFDGNGGELKIQNGPGSARIEAGILSRDRGYIRMVDKEGNLIGETNLDPK